MLVNFIYIRLNIFFFKFELNINLTTYSSQLNAYLLTSILIKPINITLHFKYRLQI